MEQKNGDIVNVLLSYQKLSQDSNNHMQLLKDKTVVLYCATLLESNTPEILNLCLDILEDFMQNQKMHAALLNTFGFFESLENLSIRSRAINKTIAERAAKMIDELKNFAPPAFGTRFRKGNYKSYRMATSIIHLYIPDLTEENRIILDEVLVSLKGIISFVVDVHKHRCTLRVGPSPKLRSILEKIATNASMSAMVITKDETTGAEKFVDALENKNSSISLLDDKEEEEECPKNQALNYITNISKNAGGLIKTATEFWNRSFYWPRGK